MLDPDSWADLHCYFHATDRDYEIPYGANDDIFDSVVDHEPLLEEGPKPPGQLETFEQWLRTVTQA